MKKSSPHIESLIQKRKILKAEFREERSKFELIKLRNPEKITGEFDASDYKRKLRNLTSLIYHHRRNLKAQKGEQIPIHPPEDTSIKNIIIDFLEQFKWPKEPTGEYTIITTAQLFDYFDTTYAKVTSDISITLKQFQIHACKEISFVGRIGYGEGRKYYYKPKSNISE
jgi:hypothetical protein